ncbi:DUF1850 domain-containing protein [Chryseomicrobium aureum]|uniref:DUF1850 domain-containing protein n=1 Tax=Chryseomicrobium aureum TaxID=1441723 RepID=UPI00370DD9DF
MLKGVFSLIVGLFLLVILFIPSQDVLVFTETRTTKPSVHYISLSDEQEFAMTFTHSIHLSDVTETYTITQDGRFQFLQMIYEDLAVGMPGDAEENQTFEFVDGKWVLTSEDTYTDSFTLYNSSIHKKLEVRYDNTIYDLKTELPTGRSYRIEAIELSIADVWKGEKIDGRK